MSATEAETPPRSDPNSPFRTYRHLVHELTQRLPLPDDTTPEALLARDEAAIDAAAAMHPVNADEAAIALRCVAARAQADDVLRLLRRLPDDASIRDITRLNAQYALMERTQMALRNQLHRLQTARHRREKDEAAARSDAWTRHVAQSTMAEALQDAPHRRLALPGIAAAAPPAAPAEAAAAPARPAAPPQAAAALPAPAPGATPAPRPDAADGSDTAEAGRAARAYPRRPALLRALAGLAEEPRGTRLTPEQVRAIAVSAAMRHEQERQSVPA